MLYNACELGLWGERYTFALMCFFALMCQYGIRYSLPIGIVAMANRSEISLIRILRTCIGTRTLIVNIIFAADASDNSGDILVRNVRTRLKLTMQYMQYSLTLSEPTGRIRLGHGDASE